MAKKLKLDIVSDVACPWCAVGIGGLEIALDRARDAVEADIRFHPFELNPAMPAGGQNYSEHIQQKYGISAEQVRINRARVVGLAAKVGFTMNTSDTSRMYNTFDAHRLLAWAKEHGRQHALKRQLLIANFTEQRDPGDHDVLADAAEKAGLDAAAAREMLASDRYADAVRSEEALWRSRGINSVPAVIVNDRYLIAGGQPPEEFERQLREIAAAM